MKDKPVFGHRHYKAIAAVFAEAENGRQSEREAATVMLGAFVRMFAADNPRFDRTRFIAAANGTPSNGRDKVRP